MTQGTDTSSYQPLGTYDPGQFEIINVRDSSLPAKVDRNVAEGRPWGVYSWIDTGEDGRYTCDRALQAIARAGHGNPPLLTWWDYEEAGVVDSQLQQAFAHADEAGIVSGYYANPFRATDALFWNRPYWLAQYPWPNDGSFPGWNRMALTGNPVKIWQFSSTNGTLDVNMIADEVWYASLFSAAPPTPTPPRKLEVPDMLILNVDTGERNAVTGFNRYSYQSLAGLDAALFVPMSNDEWLYTVNDLDATKAAATAHAAPSEVAVTKAATDAIATGGHGTKATRVAITADVTRAIDAAYQ